MSTRRVFRSVVAACMAASVVVGIQSARSAQYGDAVVAVVQDQVITVFDLQQVAGRREAQLRRQYSGAELREQLVQLRRQVADELVERELVYAEFQALEAKVPRGALQDRVDRFVLQRSGGDRRQFEEMLAAEGLTFAEFEEQVSKQLAVELLLNEKVHRHVRISPAAVERYYRENKDELSQKAGVRLQAIVLRKEDGRYSDTLDKTVRSIYARLQGGEAFGELARHYSEGPRADEGGDQGWIVAPSERLSAVLAEMSVGDVSDQAVDMGSSLYILKLTGRREAGVPPLDNDLRKEIEQRLEAQEKETRYETFIASLKQKYFVRMPEDFSDGPAE